MLCEPEGGGSLNHKVTVQYSFALPKWSVIPKWYFPLKFYWCITTILKQKKY